VWEYCFHKQYRPVFIEGLLTTMRRKHKVHSLSDTAVSATSREGHSHLVTTSPPARRGLGLKIRPIEDLD
jgi:hypothetical protein